MFNDYLEQLQEFGQGFFYGLTVGGGTLLLLFSGWLWWHYQYLNPQTVFYGAISNNLSTVGVTKHTVSTGSSGSVDQVDQLSLGAHNNVKSVSVITQNAQTANQTVVTSETLGTPQFSFARYTKVQTTQKTATGKAVDFSRALNVWSKQEAGAGGSSAFAGAVFGAFPLAHLPDTSRAAAMQSVKKDKIYTVDFTKVAKKRDKGRLYYGYDVTIAPDKYVVFLKQIDAAMGLNQLKGLDPSQYQGGTPIKLKVVADALGHQFTSVNYVGGGRQEDFSAWGVSRAVSTPSQTISLKDLQTKLNDALNQQ